MLSKRKILSLLAFLLVLPTALWGCGTEGSGSSLFPIPSLRAASDETSEQESAPSSEVESAPAREAVNQAPETSSAPSEGKPESGLDVSLELEIPGVMAAETMKNAFLYEEPNPKKPLQALENGTLLIALPTGDPLWYSTILEDGSEGYLYAECLRDPADEGGGSLFGQHARETLDGLKGLLPAGKYWNHMGTGIAYGEETPGIVTDTPCVHSQWGETYCNFYNGKTAQVFGGSTCNECLGFASYLSDCLFGEDAEICSYTDIGLLQVGDHIRLKEYEHSMTVIEITETGIAVAEANRNYQDCLIEWGRKLSFSELYSLSWDITCYSRYPFFPDGDGGFTPWAG